MDREMSYWFEKAPAVAPSAERASAVIEEHNGTESNLSFGLFTHVMEGKKLYVQGSNHYHRLQRAVLDLTASKRGM